MLPAVQVDAEEDADLPGLLQSAALALYAGLQAHLGDAAQRDALRIMLERAACIRVGSGFVPAASALLCMEQDFGPHLRAVPAAIAGPYKPLLTFLGVGRSSCSPSSCYHLCLSCMHSKFHAFG